MDRDVCYVAQLLSTGDSVLGGNRLLKQQQDGVKVSEPDTFKKLCMKAHNVPEDMDRDVCRITQSLSMGDLVLWGHRLKKQQDEEKCQSLTLSESFA